MKLLKSFLLLMVFALPLAACDNQGPAEEMGENIDNTLEDARDATRDVGKETKRAAEDAGRTIKRGAEDACDAVTGDNC